jgi:predicted helicase
LATSAFGKGPYPNTNIIFEDSVHAVLIQNGAEVIRCKTDDGPALNNLLELFFGWQRPEIAEFRKAIVQFKTDLPSVLVALRERIDDAQRSNVAYQAAADTFLSQAKTSINPSVTAADVREMLIQHILTEDIFARVYGNDDFHRENNVALALHHLDATFWRGDVKRQTLAALEPYYAAIRATAALISSHLEKQSFLKAIYENFYKVYNPKAADKLGVVYTPNEIVRFMVESADWLCEKHFKKSLIDRDVTILDPATGTGTFIVELMEHFRGRPEMLVYKYLTELYANEVAILPYYVANLNIEATYAAIVGKYEEFPGLCFVDTLDNVAALGIYSGHQHDLFATISDENSERVKRQNSRKISVIIGNPPYNAWQENYNQNNANRAYERVDQRIAATYIKEGTGAASIDMKWDREGAKHLLAGVAKFFVPSQIVPANYRPFTKRWVYFDQHLNAFRFQLGPMFDGGHPNVVIAFSEPGFRASFMTLASSILIDHHYGAAVDAYKVVSRYRYIGATRLDNITDWALKQFTRCYGGTAAISKDDIFAYVYAVLHDPLYRETYLRDLKRELPRIPLYPDFKRWRDWGRRLLDLHVGYERVEPFGLTRIDTPDMKRAEGTTPAVKLKSAPNKGLVVLDADTQLSGIPSEAWRYLLGNRAAIDWVLDQHKEKTPKDPTIREKFNTYRFADHKEEAVDLLARVVTVSLETVAITDAMAALPAASRARATAAEDA